MLCILKHVRSRSYALPHDISCISKSSLPDTWPLALYAHRSGDELEDFLDDHTYYTYN